MKNIKRIKSDMIVFLIISFILLPASSALAASSYADDQRIDEELGFFKRPWFVNMTRTYTPRNYLPRQMQPGSQPFLQQAEKAFSVRDQGLAQQGQAGGGGDCCD